MSNKKPNLTIFYLAVITMFIAPLYISNTSKTKTILTNDSKGVIRDTSFIITVTDKDTSKSGLPFCKFSISKPIDKQLIGGCSSTDDLQFELGHQYEVTKAEIKNDTLTVNKAVKTDSSYKLEVVDIKYKGHNRIAILSNGDRIIGTKLYIGDKVDVTK